MFSNFQVNSNLSNLLNAQQYSHVLYELFHYLINCEKLLQETTYFFYTTSLADPRE